ncbi:MAG: polyprenol monophosphomannose synthase [Candidatus Orphnella occulta]|nr:polyprenol monophosphomannose synthase [Candidatus Orphnella occulta]
MNKPSMSIVIPTYKEADNIEYLIKGIDHAMQNLNYEYEVVLVDDNSKDGIEDLVPILSKEYPVRIKIRKAKRDLSASVLEGFNISMGDILVVMDADLSHPPDKLQELIAPIAENRCDVSIGSRFIKGADIVGFGFFRRMNAAVSRVLARPFTNVSDPMSGFFAFRRGIIADYGILNPIGFKIALEILVKSGAEKIAEIPIRFAKRYAGRGKLSMREQFKYLWHLFRLFLFKIKRQQLVFTCKK